jgi:hypothetical protein
MFLLPKCGAFDPFAQLPSGDACRPAPLTAFNSSIVEDNALVIVLHNAQQPIFPCRLARL